MTPSSRLALGLALTAAAGFVDAIAFLQLGGFFASFMSGNTTQLGIGLAGQVGVTGKILVLFPATLIALFFTGAFTSTWLVRSHGRNGSLMVMGCVVLTLLLVSLMQRAESLLLPPVVLLAAAMGAQNAAMQSIGAARLGVTYVTGALFNAAAELADALRGQAPQWRWLQHLSVWCSLMVGAIAGGLSHYFLGVDALVIPAATILVVMIAFARSN